MLYYMTFSFRSPERRIRTPSVFKATLQDLRKCESSSPPAAGAHVKSKRLGSGSLHMRLKHNSAGNSSQFLHQIWSCSCMTDQVITSAEQCLLNAERSGSTNPRQTQPLCGASRKRRGIDNHCFPRPRKENACLSILLVTVHYTVCITNCWQWLLTFPVWLDEIKSR